MARPIWKGTISFGLVNIPVTLFSAENHMDALHFHLLDSRNNARIRYKKINESTGKEVPVEKIVKAYRSYSTTEKYCRPVSLDEIRRNDYNLNIPRYVDTFEPESRVPVKDALKALGDARERLEAAETALSNMLKGIGYAT